MFYFAGVQYVIHVQMTKTLEDFLQMSGELSVDVFNIVVCACVRILIQYDHKNASKQLRYHKT